MQYKIQYGLAVAVAFGAVIVGGCVTQADALGLTKQTLALIGIGQTCLTLAASLLPKVYRWPEDGRQGQD